MLTGSRSAKGSNMKMNFGEVFEIEDLGNHPTVTIVRLGILLAGVVNATPDPKRKYFYEVEGGPTVYYIYVSPSSGRISLLASWANALRPAPALAADASLLARPEACTP
jgi:hypothetical protein